MKVSVFGAGHIGVVTAVCLAEIGHTVVCTDSDQSKIEQLTAGMTPTYEAGLQPLLNTHLSKKTIAFTNDLMMAIQHGDVLIITVETPPDVNGHANLTYVYEAAKTIAENANRHCIVALKTTTPPGTADILTQYIERKLQLRQANITIDVASNPEFVQEGTAVQQFLHPDRIIVGANNIHTIQLLFDLYQPLIHEKEQFLIMNKASAELSKYAMNSFLATKMSFINEISQIAEQIGADMESVQNGLSKDYRINPLTLAAGCDFGDACFAKDITALITTAQNFQIKPYVLEAVIKRNLTQQQILFYKVDHFFQHRLQSKTIAFWGLSSKQSDDDPYFATSHILADLFWKAGCTIRAYDPLGMENFAKHYPDHTQLELCSSPIDALDGADVLVIITAWNEFKQVPLTEIHQRLHFKAIFDGKNIIEPSEASRYQLLYYGIGRTNSESNKVLEKQPT